jgi:uncharacterized protein with PIN domain
MEQRFIADAMLGKLARWLRVMGCDVEYFSMIDDGELVARADRSGRLILTRDTLLVRRRRARENHFFVRGDDYRDQVRQVVQAFAIDPFAHFLSRCLECNALLDDFARELAVERVPPYVFATQETFLACPVCGRLYWRGTHRARMFEELRQMVGIVMPGKSDEGVTP